MESRKVILKKRFWMLLIVAILIPLIALESGLAGVRAEDSIEDKDDTKHAMATIGSLSFTSSTTSVKAGILPEFQVDTTVPVVTVEEYGSNTHWAKWNEKRNEWGGFGISIPIAFNDGSTHYALCLQVEAATGYEISADAKVFFNGVEWTGIGHTKVSPFPWGAYVYIDLGLASGTNPITHKVVFDSKGGTNVSEQIVPMGYCVKKPAPPSLKDYYFWGWYLDEEYTHKYDFSSVLTSDITLYARWEKTVSYISEIYITSPITYVKPGVLPTITAKTSTKHVQILLDVKTTEWVYQYGSDKVVHYFRGETPIAVADGNTHYYMSLELDVEDSYRLASNVQLYFNGVRVTGNGTGYILPRTQTFGGVARIDLSCAVNKTIDLDQVIGVNAELQDRGQNLFLTWDKVEDAQDYEIWESCYNLKTGTTTDWQKIKTTPNCSYYKLSLRPNIRYDYMIRAHRLDPYGEYFGKYSEIYSFTPVSDIVCNLSSGKLVLDQNQTNAMLYMIFNDIVGYKPVNDSGSKYSMYVDLDKDGHYDVLVPEKSEDPLVIYSGRNLFDTYTISGTALQGSSFSSISFLFPKPTPTATPVPRDVKFDYTKGKVELSKLQRDALDLLVEKSLIKFRLDGTRKIMTYDIDMDGNYDLQRNTSNHYSEMLNTCSIGGEFAFSKEQLAGSNFDSIVFVFPVQEISSVSLTIDAPALGKAPSYEVKIPDEADYVNADDLFADTTNVKNGVYWLDETTGKRVDVTKGVFEPNHKYTVVIGLSPNARFQFASNVVVKINGKTATKVELKEKGLIAQASFALLLPTPTKAPGNPTPKPGDPTPTAAPGQPTPKPGDPTPTPIPDKEPSIADFVERLYTIALNRESEPEGKAFWVKEIEDGNRTGGDCAYFFLIEAPEFQNRGLSDEDFVETLYKTFFDRASEANGKAFWVGQLKKGTMTRDQVIMGFIDSKEWCNVCADYGVKSGAPTAKAEHASKNAINFATRLYTCCLGREPEETGLKYWSLALTNLEQTGCSAAKEFFTCQEFVNFKLKDDEYVKRLYRTFMDREPKAEEVTYWTGEIAKGTQTRDSVLAFFGQSEEFTNICKKYGIDRGTI